MTSLAPQSALAPRPSDRPSNAPLSVRNLPTELLDITLDAIPPTDETDFGPSAELLLTCSAVIAGIMSAALLAGELLVRLA